MQPKGSARTPIGPKVNTVRKESKNNAVNSGHYLLPAMPKCSTRTLLGPISYSWCKTHTNLKFEKIYELKNPFHNRGESPTAGYVHFYEIMIMSVYLTTDLKQSILLYLASYPSPHDCLLDSIIFENCTNDVWNIGPSSFRALSQN